MRHCLGGERVCETLLGWSIRHWGERVCEGGERAQCGGGGDTVSVTDSSGWMWTQEEGVAWGGRGGGAGLEPYPNRQDLMSLALWNLVFCSTWGGATVGSGAVPFSVVYSVAVYCLISGGWILQKMTP